MANRIVEFAEQSPAAPPPTMSEMSCSVSPHTRLTTQAAQTHTSPTSGVSQLSRFLSFPVSFGGRSLSRLATNDTRSRSRSKSPGGPSSPRTSLSKTASVTTSSTPMSSPPKRSTLDPAVSPTASSPTTNPRQKKMDNPASTSQYGRHTDDWLFGGFTVTEAVKSLIHEEEKLKAAPIYSVSLWQARKEAEKAKAKALAALWPSDSRPTSIKPPAPAAAVNPVHSSPQVHSNVHRTVLFRHRLSKTETDETVAPIEAATTCDENAREVIDTSDSTLSETEMGQRVSHSRSSRASGNAITNSRKYQASVESGAPIMVLSGRAVADIDGPARQIPVGVTTCDEPVILDYSNSEVSQRKMNLTEKISSHPAATSQPYSDDQHATHVCLRSLETKRTPDTRTNSSIQGLSDDESSSQQDLSSEDDRSNDNSTVAGKKRRILESIMEEFNNIFFQCTSGSFRCQCERPQGGAPFNAANPPASSGQGSRGRSSISAGKKRAQGCGVSSEDEDDGNQKRHKTSFLPSSPTGRARLLACPFNKHDQKIYSPCNESQDLAYKFRCCGGPGWPTVARLK
jgi:hypothetical protein